MFRVGKNSRKKEQLGCHEKDCSDQATVVTAKPWSATRTCEQHVCRRHQCPCVPEGKGNFGWLTRTRSSSWRATMRPWELDIWQTAEVRHARICHGAGLFSTRTAGRERDNGCLPGDLRRFPCLQRNGPCRRALCAGWVNSAIFHAMKSRRPSIQGRVCRTPATLCRIRRLSGGGILLELH